MASHPSWVCGLKRLRCPFARAQRMSHPSWVCGLKLFRGGVLPPAPMVTPFVGVWIETLNATEPLAAAACHTLRGCVD